MRYKLLVFDMDGTILDTLVDLRQSLNHALVLNGYPERTLAEVRAFIGNGLQKLVERALPEGHKQEETILQVLGDLREHYTVHCKDNTRPYDGIVALLQQVRALGYQTAVVSNKADFAVQELVAEFFPGLFDTALGERPGQQKKPAPDAVWKVLERLDTALTDAVYIGDSEVDLATAGNAGLDNILVAWGFRDREFLEALEGARIADTPQDILKFI